MAFLCVAVLVITVTPNESAEDMPGRRENSSLLSTLLYKGHDEGGVLGSRRSPWDETINVIQDHPWFGSGFGTSVGNDGSDMEVGQYATVSAATREHGNSYLAIMEGVGLLGVVPFIALVLALALKVGGVFAWLRRTANFGTSPCQWPWFWRRDLSMLASRTGFLRLVTTSACSSGYWRLLSWICFLPKRLLLRIA